jgi:hypothetical protein
VNVADLSWEVAQIKNDNPRLKVTGTATTFRFIEQEKNTTGGE